MRREELIEKLASSRDSEPGRALSQSFITVLAILVVALCVRFFIWQDNQLDVRQIQGAVTDGYKHLGRLLVENGWAAFFDPASPVSDPIFLGHPPGYSFLWAIIFRLLGDSEGAMRVAQAVADAASAVVVFLIALELLPRRVAAVAGLLVAVSPQFAYNSILLLPDSLSVLPILLSVYLLVRARLGPRFVHLLSAFWLGSLAWGANYSP